ncbi:HTH domain-containing protein [Virgibacillus dokdonensis]|uniref:HTH domain-containing protein n=1 Tax=Virgibacillus dokdonensis TaxID=302167 RepID=UPI00098B21F9|nr:HTH domain-containing protein [Virgibacillus dokdonensis]
MDIKSGDPRDDLKIILEDYKITPYTFGLISGLDEKTVMEFANHKNDLEHLSHEQKGHIVSMIGLLSDGMTLVTADERVKAIIEILNGEFQISNETLALYAKIDEIELDEFMKDCDSLTFDKRYRLAVVALFLVKLFSDNIKNK